MLKLKNKMYLYKRDGRKIKKILEKILVVTFILLMSILTVSLVFSIDYFVELIPVLLFLMCLFIIILFVYSFGYEIPDLLNINISFEVKDEEIYYLIIRYNDLDVHSETRLGDAPSLKGIDLKREYNELVGGLINDGYFVERVVNVYSINKKKNKTIIDCDLFNYLTNEVYHRKIKVYKNLIRYNELIEFLSKKEKDDKIDVKIDKLSIFKKMALVGYNLKGNYYIGIIITNIFVLFLYPSFINSLYEDVNEFIMGKINFPIFIYDVIFLIFIFNIIPWLFYKISTSCAEILDLGLIDNSNKYKKREKIIRYIVLILAIIIFSIVY